MNFLVNVKFCLQESRLQRVDKKSKPGLPPFENGKNSFCWKSSLIFIYHIPWGKKQKGKLSTTGHPATLQSCRNSNWSHCYNPGTEAETRFNSIWGDRDKVNGANLTEMTWHQGKEVTGNSWWIRNSGTARSFSTFQIWKTKNGVFFSDKIWAEDEKAHLLQWQG